MSFFKAVIVAGSFLIYLAQAAAYNVVTSIIPLQSLAAYLLEGIAEPQVILDGSESAHTYALRPLDIQKLKQADSVVWLGPTYEGFLTKAIALSQRPTLSILEALKADLLPLKEPHTHDHGLKITPDLKELSHYDPHVWLDPLLCQKILRAMHQHFIQSFPQEKAKLDKNLDQALHAMNELHKSLQEGFKDIHDKPFMVYHDGYQYLEKAFQLKNVGVVLPHPEVPMTLQDRDHITKLLQSYPNLCIFSESQFSPKILENLRNILSFQTETLDPIGIGLKGKEAYAMLMNHLLASMKKCLS